jgi:hypothetical protein
MSACVQSHTAESAKLEAALEEVSEATLAALVTSATEKCDASKADLAAAEHAVEAATRELAGAESGDGRDKSNRSLPEQVHAAQSDQVRSRPQPWHACPPHLRFSGALMRVCLTYCCTFLGFAYWLLSPWCSSSQ